ncbi:MAG: hypothetical protein ABIJ56_07330 [Pseudomonadota bacterium]
MTQAGIPYKAVLAAAAGVSFFSIAAVIKTVIAKDSVDVRTAEPPDDEFYDDDPGGYRFTGPFEAKAGAGDTEAAAAEWYRSSATAVELPSGGLPMGFYWPDDAAASLMGEPIGSLTLYGSSGGSYYHYGSSYSYTNYYAWLRKYIKWLRNKYASEGWKNRRWLMPGSQDSYFVHMPGGFGVYNASSGGWLWSSDTDGEDARASDPVFTESSVSVLISGPKDNPGDPAPITLASYDRDTGTPIFETALPPDIRSISIDERDGVLSVETCGDGGDSCESHQHPL